MSSRSSSTSSPHRTELLLHPTRLPLVAASILSADFARLSEECRAVLERGADLLHLDVMDGHFVPNLTMGPALCASLRHALPDAVLDVHLMVTSPAMFVKPFADAGADNFTFHIEAVPQPAELINQIHGAGMTAGLAINPPTDVNAIMPHVEAVDMVLVMSVNPGFAGQGFMPAALEKVQALRGLLRPDQRLEMDGGISPETAGACIGAGCDLLVAASAIFGKDDYAAAIDAIRSGQARGV